MSNVDKWLSTNLYFPPAYSDKLIDKIPDWIVGVIAVGALLLIAVAAIVAAVCHRRRQRRHGNAAPNDAVYADR